MEDTHKTPDLHTTIQEGLDDTGNTLKHEAVERIFSLLLFLLAQ